MEIKVEKHDGTSEKLDVSKIHKSLGWAAGSSQLHAITEIITHSKLHFYDGIKTSKIHDTLIKTARELSDIDNIEYDTIAKNLLLQKLYKDVCNSVVPTNLYDIIVKNVNLGYYTNRLLTDFTEEEIRELDGYIDHTRNFNFTYAGLSFLIERYSIKHNGKAIELPQHMFMAIAMDVFRDYHTNRFYYIKTFYDLLSSFKITLPSPEVQALRTSSHDYASCILIKIGDSLDSWVEGSKSVVLHTASSAGVGIDISEIASIGDVVRGGKIVHGGKIPILHSLNTDINKAVQMGRRGSGTAFVSFYDKEIMEVLSLKSPRTSIEKRINDLSYGIKVNKLLYERAKENRSITLFSSRDSKELYEVFHSSGYESFKSIYKALEEKYQDNETIPAITLLKAIAKECFENSSYYIVNIDEVNRNSPYTEKIYQSNICVEELSPTKNVSADRPDDPDIAVCVLGNINQGKVNLNELPTVTDIILRAQTHLMLRQNHPTSQANSYVYNYRSIGIGLSNHAYWLAKNGFKYGSKLALAEHHKWMESFQFNLIKASVNLAKEIGQAPHFHKSTYSKGILPIDRYNTNIDTIVDNELYQDWEELRNSIKQYGMANVALSMIPPAESSAIPSNQTNGLEPIKDYLTYKENKTQTVKQFAPNLKNLYFKYELAYSEGMTKKYLKHVAVSQKFLDKSISANRFYNPELNGGMVSMKEMLSDIYYARFLGIKTLYYTNTNVENVENKSQCLGGSCEV